jgi:hypothetical protein
MIREACCGLRESLLFSCEVFSLPLHADGWLTFGMVLSGLITSSQRVMGPWYIRHLDSGCEPWLLTSAFGS